MAARALAVAVVCVAAAATAGPDLELKRQPPKMTMRPKRANTTAAAAPKSAPEPPVATPPAATPATAPSQPIAEPAQVRDLAQRVSARVNFGYVVDGTQLTQSLPPRTTKDSLSSWEGATDNTSLAYFSKTRAYGFGEGYLSTHGLVFDSLSSYFAGRSTLVNRNQVFAPNSQELLDVPGTTTRPSPIATWFERSGFEPRSAWIEAKDFLPQKWLSPLRIRAGEQYVYGPWVLHFYGLVNSWDGKLVHAQLYLGSYVPDYTFNSALPSARAGIGGWALKFDLKDLASAIPVTVGVQQVNLTSGTNAESSSHTQYEADWRPRRDLALIASARQLANKFVNQHLQMRARYREVTNLVFDLTHHASTDWRWDPTVLDPDPQAPKRYLDLGPVLPQLLVSARAGTLIAENIDVYLRGALSSPLGQARTHETYSAPYLEVGGAFEVRVRRTVAVGASLLTRQTNRDDQVTAEIIDTPNQPDLIPENASSQMGERNFVEGGATTRLSLGARKFSMLIEFYGRRTHYALDYCALAAGMSDCRSALVTGVQQIGYRFGGRAQIDAWIGNRLRLFASYDLSGAPDFVTNVTGYKSLRLMMEGIY